MRAQTDPARPRSRLSGATASFFNLLPALLVALTVLRVAELLAASEAGGSVADFVRLVLWALLVDALNLARTLPLLFLLSLPLLMVRPPGRAGVLLAAAWSLPVLALAGLVQYSLVAGVPLGADWAGYAITDLQSTVNGGIQSSPWVVAGVLLALAALWWLVSARNRLDAAPSKAHGALLLGGLLALALVPPRSEFIATADEHARSMQVSKLSFFIDDNIAYFMPVAWTRVPTPPAADALPPPPTASAMLPEFDRLDPAFPFLHTEQTPDALGPFLHIRADGPPPNIVLIIVEGLGRSFSGPDALLGSFTPELDKLAERSLYWENFLAVQGRTFGVIPSLMGSAPFGRAGLSALGENMPPHHSLPSVLKDNGYAVNFYCGYNADFDNEAVYLGAHGVDRLVDRFNFGEGYQTSNSWGYGDAELVSRVLAAETIAVRQEPTLTVLKTVTMHTPYVFLGQEGFTARFERRLDELGIPEPARARYRRQRGIYTSILYADQALGRYFAHARGIAGFDNTVFVVVGDHRLPEIPMATRIDRYHVPLLIYSPLLKAPARFKSVSSHFDIAPSLLAFLSANYGLQRPPAVTWLGHGLDTAAEFRNLRRFPMKQTKTNLVDFVSGPWFINQQKLYTLRDGMRIETAEDAGARESTLAQFASFRRDNDSLIRTGALAPPAAAKPQSAWRSRKAVPIVHSLRQVPLPAGDRRGALAVEVTFENRGEVTTPSFEPIVVLSRDDGGQVSETYGEYQRLLPGQRHAVRFLVGPGSLPPGRYFASAIAVRPRTSRRIGTGKHRVAVQAGR